MRQVEYTNGSGRRFLVRLPDDAPDEDAPIGIPIGPPEIVDDLDLPEPLATRLHNQLAARRLWTYKDIQRRSSDLQGALQAALQLDVQAIAEAYKAYENPKPLEE
jgi:hypothetical protein